MTSTNDGDLALSARLLAEYAYGISRMSALLTVSLSCYECLAQCAVADILELLSAITADLNRQGLDVVGNEMADNMLADEPTSFAEAVEKLPAFLAHVLSAVAALSISSGTELTSISVRAQTFAFHLRRENGSRPENGSELNGT